ncbi:MAG: NepR family anti-sigma factor [Sphingobium sp.]
MMNDGTETPKSNISNADEGQGELSTGSSSPSPGNSLPPTNEEADLGNALRNVYQQTVEEDIPQEMLDLLNRLG